MTTSVAPPRVLSNKATLIGVAIPTPTRKDGTPVPLADTPPEGFHKAKLPKTDAPPAVGASVPATARSEAHHHETSRVALPVTDHQKGAHPDPAKHDASTRVTRRDLPVQATSRSSMPVAKPATSSSSRLLTLGFAAGALVLGARWYSQHHQADNPRGARTAPASAPASPTSVQVVPPPADSAAALDPAPAAASAAATATGAADPTKAPADAAGAMPAPAVAAPSSSSDPTTGTRTVIVKISPPAAKLYRKGKAVGASPVTIELPPGEKRYYEVGMPGWVTRRLVVDGSKPEIFIGLKQEAGAKH